MAQEQHALNGAIDIVIGATLGPSSAKRTHSYDPRQWAVTIYFHPAAQQWIWSGVREYHSLSSSRAVRLFFQIGKVPVRTNHCDAGVVGKLGESSLTRERRKARFGPRSLRRVRYQFAVSAFSEVSTVGTVHFIVEESTHVLSIVGPELITVAVPELAPRPSPK